MSAGVWALVGSISTALILFGAMKYFEKLYSLSKPTQQYNFSQSSLHEVIKPLLPIDLFTPEPKKTQSFLHEQRTNLRVIIMDGLAYWIKDNKFYEADIMGNDIDKDSARVVDTMGLDKVQLDKMLFIMDRLREGLPNDSGSAGDK
jgi:hypothetical protein